MATTRRLVPVIISLALTGCGQSVVVGQEKCSNTNPCPQNYDCVMDKCLKTVVEIQKCTTHDECPDMIGYEVQCIKGYCGYLQIPETPAPTKECVTNIKYFITDFYGNEVDRGEITRDLDCCNSDADCANSAYGHHCVVLPRIISENPQFALPGQGYAGFCQWCDQDKQEGCPPNLVCHWGAESLLPRTGSDRLLTENGGTYTPNGPESRSVNFCETADLCGDGKQNATETDVDCGTHGFYPISYAYGCDQCRNGQKCVDDFDCESHWCSHGTCASCRDDIDCRVGYTCKGGTCMQ